MLSDYIWYLAFNREFWIGSAVGILTAMLFQDLNKLIADIVIRKLNLKP